MVSFEFEEPSRAGNGFILFNTKRLEKKLTLDWQMDENVFGTLLRIMDCFVRIINYYRRETKILYLIWK